MRNDSLEQLKANDPQTYKRRLFRRGIFFAMLVFVGLPVSTFIAWTIQVHNPGRVTFAAFLDFFACAFLCSIYLCLKLTDLLLRATFGEEEIREQEERNEEVRKRIEQRTNNPAFKAAYNKSKYSNKVSAIAILVVGLPCSIPFVIAGDYLGLPPKACFLLGSFIMLGLTWLITRAMVKNKFGGE